MPRFYHLLVRLGVDSRLAWVYKVCTLDMSREEIQT